MRMVELVASRRVWRRVGLMYAVGAPFVLISIAGAADANGTERLMFVALLLVMLGLPFLPFAMRGTWVRRFDGQGVTTHGKRSFEWKDFQRVETIKRSRWTSHRELVFATGRAVVPPPDMVSNPAELVDIVTELARGENRFTAALTRGR